MTLLGIFASATIAWIFGYLYAAQSIKTQTMRSYNVTVSHHPALKVVK